MVSGACSIKLMAQLHIFIAFFGSAKTARNGRANPHFYYLATTALITPANALLTVSTAAQFPAACRLARYTGSL